MVLLSKTLLALAVLNSCAVAYHPFRPKNNCRLDGTTCSESKRHSAVEKRSPIGGIGFVTFPIKQNVPDVAVSHDVRLRTIVDRIKRKYKGRTIEETAEGTEKRSNNYNIVTSIIPTLPNSVALYQDGTDFSYFTVVNFGSGGTPMYMLMDTGASSTWVMGSGCISSACQKHNTFGAVNSKTLQPSSETFQIGYGTGNVNGTFATDKVSFAGFSLTMTFGIASYTSDDFLNFPMDGIMGLSRAAGAHPTVLDNIVTSKSLSSNVFGVNINRNSDNSHNGVINFGGPDPSMYTGSLSYTPCTNANEWIIKPDDVGTNNKGVGISGSRVAYIDTGTSYIFLPPDDAKVLYSTIAGSILSADGNSWTVPCSTTTPVQFFFSGIAYSVSSKDWVGGKTSGNANMCTSNIYPLALVGEGAWLLGDTFLKNVYAVFDTDKSRIGFGVKSAAASSPVISSTTSSSTTPAIASPAPTFMSVASTQNSNPASAVSPSSTGLLTTSATSILAPSTQTSPLGTSEPFNAHITPSSPSAPVAAAPQTSSTSSPAPSPTGNLASKRFDSNLLTASISLLTILLCATS